MYKCIKFVWLWFKQVFSKKLWKWLYHLYNFAHWCWGSETATVSSCKRKIKKNIANSFCTVYLLETVCNEQRRRNIQFRWTRSLHAIYSCVVFGCITFPSNLSCICVLTASILKYLFWRSSKVARAIEIEGEKSRYFWFLYFIGKDWGYILIS